MLQLFVSVIIERTERQM